MQDDRWKFRDSLSSRDQVVFDDAARLAAVGRYDEADALCENIALGGDVTSEVVRSQAYGFQPDNPPGWVKRREALRTAAWIIAAACVGVVIYLLR